MVEHLKQKKKAKERERHTQKEPIKKNDTLEVLTNFKNFVLKIH